MMPDVPVRDVMQRTMANYRFMEQQYKEGAQVFEVTQMVNSFLGAFAYPWEEWRRELKSIPLDEAYERGWPEVNAEDDRDEQPKTLGDLLRLIRNALAHGNMQYLNDRENGIRALHLWNAWNGYKTWGATLEIATLQMFLERFEGEANALPDRPIRQPPTRHFADRKTTASCPKCNRPFPQGHAESRFTS